VGEWRKTLTRTPYLVLFIILISIAVGTASALITITLAGNVIVTGDLKMTGGDLSIENPGNDARILLGINDPDNNDVILFDDGSKILMWDESESQFEFSDAIVTSGVIQAGNVGADVAYNRLGSGTADSVFVTIGNDLFVSGDIESGNNIVVGSDIFVGMGNETDNDLICMDGPICDEFIAWNTLDDRFEWSNDGKFTENVMLLKDHC